ncbi:MAG: cysteine hydrolase [Phycisphaerales bacterium]|nr:cysteine hydrolase [Phycisphaerales bacterium]
MSQLSNTAILLIGLQNDHFGPNCALRSSIESPERIDLVKSNILSFIQSLLETDVSIVNLPILFREGHPEITQEIGILAAIKQNGLFVEGTTGGCVIEELLPLENEMMTLPGRTGFNTFVDTQLNEYLTENNIRQILLAGASTAVCIDSTARSGYELGFDVVVLKDCTISRTPAEQDMYCQSIFPIYASVTNSGEWLQSHGIKSTTGSTEHA